jgi:CO/xanthine dehydrogenase Mo-binding subunit
VSRSDGRPKVEGSAVYGVDLREDGMLWGALVLAPSAHGRITRIDLARARSMPGVAAVIGPDEVRALLPTRNGDGERPVFARSEVVYRNQPVAAVAATSRAEAQAAARAVSMELAPLRVVPDVESIYPEWPADGAPSAPEVIAHVHARHGDLAACFRAADYVHAETYRTSGIHQVALEPHACVARVEGERWFVRTSTQTPFGVREDSAEILGIPEERIVVEGTWVGGGFGGKGSSFLEPYALLLSAATGRPVKLQLSHREEFLLGRTTLPMVVRVETAVLGGRMTARRARLLLDSGASLPGRDFATGFVIGFLLGPYRLDAFEMEGFGIRTNKPPFGPHRAPLTPQCVFVEESHTDSIARTLGVDPIEFRLRQVWREGDQTHLGQTVGPFGIEEGLRRAQALVREWRRNLPRDHGIGVAVGFWSTGTGAGGEARVRLAPSGLTIVQVEREIGSGSVVGGLSRVAERVTGLPPEAVHVEHRDTSEAPYDSGVFGSRTVGALGQAVEKATRRLLQGLGERFGPGIAVTLAWHDGRVCVVAGDRRIPIEEILTEAERTAGAIEASGRHFGAPGKIDEGRVVTGSFYPYSDFTGTVAIVEARVDRETGAVTPVRVASFPDVGVALDPALVVAQVEGGVVMGLGTALTEEMLWGPDGRLGNPHFLDYRIPTLGEVPSIQVDPVEGFLGAGPFGAKGVGEPPIIPVPAAVANAVADAVGARVTELPLSAERVARALKLL